MHIVSLLIFKVLTESKVSLDGKNRVMKILEDQKKTLRLCMSKPEVSFLYILFIFSNIFFRIHIIDSIDYV